MTSLIGLLAYYREKHLGFWLYVKFCFCEILILMFELWILYLESLLNTFSPWIYYYGLIPGDKGSPVSLCSNPSRNERRSTFFFERNVLILQQTRRRFFLLFILFFGNFHPLLEPITNAFGVGLVDEVIMVPYKPVSPFSSFVSGDTPEARAKWWGTLQLLGFSEIHHRSIILIIFKGQIYK